MDLIKTRLQIQGELNKNGGKVSVHVVPVWSALKVYCRFLIEACSGRQWAYQKRKEFTNCGRGYTRLSRDILFIQALESWLTRPSRRRFSNKPSRKNIFRYGSPHCVSKDYCFINWNLNYIIVPDANLIKLDVLSLTGDKPIQYSLLFIFDIAGYVLNNGLVQGDS